VTSVLSAITNMLAEMAAQWAVKRLMNMVGAKTEALSNIGASAAAAGAAGVASFAMAPWPIDLGAPAFGAAMSLAAMSFAPAVAAAGGFDIPSGMNPITQLHQEEMVLPARLANAVRGMAGGSGGGTHNHYHIDGVIDGASAKRFFLDNQDHLATALHRAHQGGHFAKY
jgi:hypothetical protein